MHAGLGLREAVGSGGSGGGVELPAASPGPHWRQAANWRRPIACGCVPGRAGQCCRSAGACAPLPPDHRCPASCRQTGMPACRRWPPAAAGGTRPNASWLGAAFSEGCKANRCQLSKRGAVWMRAAANGACEPSLTGAAQTGQSPGCRRSQSLESRPAPHSNLPDPPCGNRCLALCHSGMATHTRVTSRVLQRMRGQLWVQRFPLSGGRRFLGMHLAPRAWSGAAASFNPSGWRSTAVCVFNQAGTDGGGCTFEEEK